MKELHYTLITDGSSDTVLMPILTWALRANGVSCAIQPYWADLGIFRKKLPRLSDRICQTTRYYPCDILFIHRDAEREPKESRVDEIKEAIHEVCEQINEVPPAISVVPVRMQEAWLLFNKNAIRHAAGNPNGRQAFHLPRFSQIESLPDPKKELHTCLKQASGLAGRRLKKFRVNSSAHRVAEFIEDFSLLRELSAFSDFENELVRIIEKDFSSYC